MDLAKAGGQTATWFSHLSRWRGSTDTALVDLSSATGTQDWDRWSGTRLLGVAAELADWLASLNTPVGRPLPALVGASPGAYALVMAAAAIRRPLAPLPPLHTQAELAACIKSLDAGILLADDSSAAVAIALGEAAGVEVHLVPNVVAGVGQVDLRAAPDDPVIVIHTSGTSGRPKAVLHEQRHLADRSRLLGELLEIGVGDVLATASPFHHIAGFGTGAAGLASGATLVPVRRFDPAIWQCLGGLGATHALAVPTVIDLLMEQGALIFDTLRVLAYGGAPMHPDTLTEVLAAAPELRLVQIFGQTEGSPITSLRPHDHDLAATSRPELLRSVGRAVPGLELRIDHPDDQGVGEVMARAAHLAGASLGNWLHTGDLGRVDDDYLFLVGRLGDRIVRGGENVDPAEIEIVLSGLSSVREAAVVGLEDQRWGEVVAAAVVATDPGDPPSIEDMRTATRELLAGFKVPTVWVEVVSLPRNAAGKVDRRAVRRLIEGVPA